MNIMKSIAVKLVVLGGAVLLLLLLASSKLRSKLYHKWQRVEVELCLPSLVPQKSALLSPEWDKEGLDSPAFWIAHGGGIGEFVYTNCAEAVQDSLHRGFSFIEIDLMETSDGHLVGGHSWQEVRKLVGAAEGAAALSKAEIEALRPHWKRTPLFAGDICRFLRENPQMILVTDKTQNFGLLLREIPFADRMVVEAFSCYDYLRALRAGARHVALSAWSVHGLQQAQKYKLPGVVLSATVIRDDPAALPLIQQMHREGCCITVHWASVSDKPDFVHEHLGRNISRLYTDTWSPSNVPPAP